MKNYPAAIKLIIISCWILPVVPGSSQKPLTGINPIQLHDVLNVSRIKNSHYKLVMYSEHKDTIRDMAITDRHIERQIYNSILCLKVTEINTMPGSTTKTIVYADQKTLAPVYYESWKNDTMTRKAVFRGNEMTVSDFENDIESKSVHTIPGKPYFSHSFSELVQSNDFSKTKVITFETLTPGRPIGRFVAERTGEKEFVMAEGKAFLCWLVKFTRIDQEGKSSIVGYRFIDKVSGQVIMYKSDLGPGKVYAYQQMFLQ